ncbi:hypothetical protein HanIR_Chr10g0458481 [Helianthus annuus]|nr:hypothetical protein HanIR_Chr10g0458481 [Helianthus annuus]
MSKYRYRSDPDQYRSRILCKLGTDTGTEIRRFGTVSVRYRYFKGKSRYFTDTVPYRYRKITKVDTISGTENGSGSGFRDRDGILYPLLIPSFIQQSFLKHEQ